MNKEITTKTNPAKIMEYFRECGARGSTNLDIGNGDFIYLVGGFKEGILSKLENGQHYIAIKKINMWVKV